MKIAFLDHRLTNWHAKTFRDLLKSGEYAAELSAVSSENHEEGGCWAAESGIPYIRDIREMKGEIDGVMVLAPSNPEVHLGLVRKAVLLGVPVYVDKTFAPSRAEAEAIYAASDEANVPLFSTSALRYADELTPIREWGEGLLQAQAYGGGGNFSEYVIHPLEMIISLFGVGVQDVDIRRSGEFRQITLDYGGRVGTVFSNPGAQMVHEIVAAREGEAVRHPVTSPIFKNLMRGIVEFFQTGHEPVNRAETLKIIELIELITK